MPQNEQLINSNGLFLTVLEAHSLTRAPEQSGSMLCESLLPSSKTEIFSQCSPIADGAGEISQAPFMRALIPLWELHPHCLTTPAFPHLLKPSQGILGFSIQILRGYKLSNCSRCYSLLEADWGRELCIYS